MTERSVKPPVFHERRTYRRRRVMDAAKVAPVLTLVLWLIPLFWPQTGSDTVSSASALIYIFIVWVGAIALTFALSWALRDQMDAPPDNRS